LRIDDALFRAIVIGDLLHHPGNLALPIPRAWYRACHVAFFP
jgi:hypothetical protein